MFEHHPSKLLKIVCVHIIAIHEITRYNHHSKMWKGLWTKSLKNYIMCCYKTSRNRLFQMEWSCVPFHNIKYDYHIILNIMDMSQMKATHMICIVMDAKFYLFHSWK
jgi:hypothetical protein